MLWPVARLVEVPVESGGSPAGSLLKMSLECMQVLAEPGFQGHAYILYFVFSVCVDINCFPGHICEGAGAQ